MIAAEGRSKPVTLEDIAKLAGVNRRTVRDALQGTGRVAAITRENVLRITQELNYVPNASARALAKGRTGRVTILSGSLNHPYNANVVHFLDNFLNDHGYETMLVQSRHGNQAVQSVKASLSDGVIVVGAEQIDESVGLGHVASPWVLIDTSTPKFMDHITLDLFPAVNEALRLMIDSGRKRIAYVNNDGVPANPEVRCKTYLNLMKEIGREPEIIDMKTDVSPEERVEFLRDYFEQHGCPGALFCQNDETAMYTYRVLADLGYRLPTDVMLAGCDGLPYMKYFDVPISTIALPMEEVCEVACSFLQQRITDPNIPIQEHTVRGQLLIRESLLAEV